MRGGVVQSVRLVACGLAGLAALRLSGADIAWPTPDRACFEGKPIETFVQPTESGLLESGLFGCVRTGGRQFHEALDLRPIRHDKRGEALDEVFSILPGVVRHVNDIAGKSNYGRYVVIEHTGEKPAVISLYAHLAAIAPGLQPGATVQAGQAIGVMGRSAAGYSIPRERAHLHLEVGLWLGERFDAWYASKKFKARNEHGVFNGMNIVGFDFLDFMERRRAGQVQGFRDYLVRQPTAASVVVRTTQTPDFVARYPEFLRAAVPADGPAGWRIELTWFGLPKAWWPLSAEEMAAYRGASPGIVFTDPELLVRYPCQGVVRNRKGDVVPGPRLADALGILFR